jgi:hypothetical protein
MGQFLSSFVADLPVAEGTVEVGRGNLAARIQPSRDEIGELSKARGPNAW